MSHKETDKWLEAAREHLDAAIEEGNYPLVKDIIADVLDVSPEAGRAMNEEVRELPVSTWKVISPNPEA